MASVRILHVDDEPDMRQVVELSLGLDPAFSVRSCASGMEALSVAADWSPDLILLDVMMPDMDGPTTLARLRHRSQTAGVPVVFLTSRARASEIDLYLSLGASGVIAKPFDLTTLAARVRRYVPTAQTRISMRRNAFLIRARADAAVIAGLGQVVATAENSSARLHKLESITHDLAEDAIVHGFHRLSLDARMLEDAVFEAIFGDGVGEIQLRLECLLARIERESVCCADS